MKLNDPFGRMERRHQAGYESMAAALRKSGIDTPEAAQELIQQSKKRMQTFLGAVLIVLMLVILLLPKALPVVICLAVLFLVWVINSAVNGQRYIKQYIEEELEK